jgi:thiamine-phosphate pyrophosphorylase
VITPRRPLLNLVTDRRRAGGPDRLLALMAAAARAGVDIIQIRERDLDDRGLLALVTSAVRDAPQARIVVNDRVDIALAAGASGVHLRGDSMAAAEVRRVASERFLIGRSVHTASEAARIAADGGCDYLLFGAVFPTVSKGPGHPIAGTVELARACAAVREVSPTLPVLAIGGIGLDTVPQVGQSGAAGVAAIGLFLQVADMQGLMADVRRRFDS